MKKRKPKVDSALNPLYAGVSQTVIAPPKLTLEQRVGILESQVNAPSYPNHNDINPYTLLGKVELLYRYFKLAPHTTPGVPPKTELVKDEQKSGGWLG